MFIPNKTFHAVRAITLSVIASLSVLIAGGTFFYVKLSQQNEQQIAVLQARIDSLTSNTSQLKTSSSQQFTVITDDMITTQATLTAVDTNVTSLLNDVDALKSSVEMLIRNECHVMPYYMDEKLITRCKSQ